MLTVSMRVWLSSFIFFKIKVISSVKKISICSILKEHGRETKCNKGSK